MQYRQESFMSSAEHFGCGRAPDLDKTMLWRTYYRKVCKFNVFYNNAAVQNIHPTLVLFD